ncbi:MAG: hypothetical protein ACE5HV_09520 [Acidobacteriota bacterium]
MAEVADARLSNASRDLSKLAQRSMLTRVKRGLWAVTNHPDFSPYAVVPFLFGAEEKGYVSLLTAMNLHGMVDQIPQVILVVTLTQRPRLMAPVGTYEFHQLHADLFGGYRPYRHTGSFQIGTREKSLFDALYLSACRGQRFAHLPEIDLGDDFSESIVRGWIGKIDHRPLRIAVADKWEKFLVKQELRRAAQLGGAAI